MITVKRAKNLNESKSIKVPDNFVKVNVLSWHKKDTEYYDLSPYNLKTDGNESDDSREGILFENYWQGSKVFPKVYPLTIKPHYTSNKIWWSFDRTEEHIVEDEVQDCYFRWREEIFNCENPIRYPNSYHRRHQCAFSLFIKNGRLRRYGYIEARKKIYVKQYMRLVRNKSSYQKILRMLNDGINICIVEVDVPAEGKKGFQGRYHNEEITIEKLRDMINDSSEPFGHGLALSAALLEDLN